MKKIAIITDSTSDLSKEMLEKYEIDVIPLHIRLGEEDYLDGANITPEELYAWADKHGETPKTSTISIPEAMDCIQAGLERAEKLIVFCISQQMSSCYSVMNIAVEELEMQDRVFVIDSKNLSTGIGLQILEAQTMIEKGMEAEEIAEQILNMQEKVRASFVVDTLTYLYRGGRCSGVAAMAGGALKLHPYISVAEGKMQPGKKYRGKMQKVILDYVEDLKPDLLNAKADNLFITHSGCEEEILEMVQEELKQLQYFKNIYVTRAGGVISSHCGPGTLGVLFIQK